MPIAIHDDDHDIVKVTPPGSSPRIKMEKLPEDEKPFVDAEVQRRIDETVRRIREQTDKIQAAASPYARQAKEFADQQPVLFTFLAIFTITSAVPILLFIGFLIGATITVLGIAAIGICLSLLTAILIGVAILLPVLLFTFMLSTSALTFLVSVFLAHRLYLHLAASSTEAGTTSYETVSRGVATWIDETKERVGIDGIKVEETASNEATPMPNKTLKG